MSFWTWLKGDHDGITPNSNPAGVPPSVGVADYTPGDPHGVEMVGERTETRSLPYISPSPWDGWPSSWGVPNWDFGSRLNELVDVAWACLDLNSSVLSAMPVYRTRNGRVIPPSVWMTNPDPTIYTSWHEFAKQLFWDYQLGEAFVLPVVRFTDGFPMTFRVVPPWMIHVEMRGGVRVYRLGGIGGIDVTDEILHVRYKSSTDNPHGVGPLEAAGGRMLTAGVLARYVRDVVATGGVPDYTLEVAQSLTGEQAQALLTAWMASRVSNLGAPAVLDSGVTLKTHPAMSPKDMAMLEIAQFTESRIAVLLGVPPFLVGLPSGGDSMTYSNVSSLFDFHDRASLRPKALHVMAAVSDWALPPAEMAELNRDEYSRPSFAERVPAWVQLMDAGVIDRDEVRAAERFIGTGATAALTGGSGGNRSDVVGGSPRELAEMVQKIYLGVGVVLSADEARAILNEAGAGLTGAAPAPKPAARAPALTGGET